MRVLRAIVAGGFVLAAACTSARPAVTDEVPAEPQPTETVTVHSARAPAMRSDPIEVAITVDDLPRHGTDLSGVTRLAIHERMLDAFEKHRTPPVVGFVNGQGLEGSADGEAALVAWLARGHLLANHTYSHKDGAAVPLGEFLADVDANEPVLRRLVGDSPASVHSWKVFRYPFLREGADLEAHAGLRQALLARDYRLAPVTIDFYDWSYGQAYARCLAKGDETSIAGLRESFIDQAAAELRWADGAARELAGRPIKQILLVHVGAFTALMMEEMLTTYEKQGAKFITLDDALSDPFHATEPTPRKTTRGNLLWQTRNARGTRSPSVAPPPDTLLDLVCR